jgi:hypothetical protein
MSRCRATRAAAAIGITLRNHLVIGRGSQAGFNSFSPSYS